VPADSRLEYLVGLVHHQRLRDVVGEMPGGFHVPVAATLHPLPGQAESLPPGFRVHLAAHIAGPVRVNRGTSVALQGTPDRPHRRVQLLQAVQVVEVVDVQRQADHRQFRVLAPLPALALVLPPEPASGQCRGGRARTGGVGRHIGQHGAHRLPTSLLF
jgi:hypothetical protein